MGTTDYFEQYVWPNYQAFCANPGSKYLAMNAVVAAYHMLECAAFCKLKSKAPTAVTHTELDYEVKKLRPYVLGACPDLELVEDAATAYKHILTRPTAANKRPRIFTELVKVRTASRDTRWRDIGAWNDSRAWQDHYQSVVIDDGGTEHELLLTLNNVVAYWGDYIYGSKPDWTKRRPEPDAATGILR